MNDPAFTHTMVLSRKKEIIYHNYVSSLLELSL